MRKAGGVVALLAGILATVAAVVKLLFEGLGGALEADDATVVIGFGLDGIVFPFLTVVCGAAAISAEGKIPGALIILFSVGGAFLGSNVVAVCMGLAAIGGVLAVVVPAKKTKRRSRFVT